MAGESRIMEWVAFGIGVLVGLALVGVMYIAAAWLLRVGRD